MKVHALTKVMSAFLLALSMSGCVDDGKLDSDVDELRHVRTILGGCDTDISLQRNSSDNVSVSIHTFEDSIRVLIELNYNCGAPFEAHYAISKNIVRMYITDACDDGFDCYYRCKCDYTFEYLFTQKGDADYQYVVELMSPLVGQSGVIAVGNLLQR